METFADRLDQWIDRFESEDSTFSNILKRMSEDIPNLTGYYTLPQFEDLSDDESDYMISIATLLYAAYTDGGTIKITDRSFDEIQTMEDKHWKMWEALPGKSPEAKFDALPETFWDSGTEFITMMIENDPDDDEWDCPPALQEIYFVSLLTFYDGLRKNTLHIA